MEGDGRPKPFQTGNAWEVKLLNRDSVKKSLTKLLEAYEPQNIFVREPDIEDIVAAAYQENARQ